MGPIPRARRLLRCVGARWAWLRRSGRRRQEKTGGGCSSACPAAGSPAFDPVIDIPVLDHRVSPVTGYDDVVQYQDPDPVQQPLELNGGGDILRGRGAGSARMVMGQQDAVGVVVQGGFHHQPGIGGNLGQGSG